MNKIDRDACSHYHSMVDYGDDRNDKEIEKDASWRALHDQTPKRSREDAQKEKDRLTDKRKAAKAYVKGYNFKNESRHMNKKLIRLTESDLHRIVKESVNRVIKESNGGIDPSQIDFGLGSANFDPRYKGVIRAVRNLVNELEAVGADSDLIERANSIEWEFVDSYGNNGITNDMLR